MKKNFTLIELIVVIAVLGILAAIVIPNISSFRDRAQKTAVKADIKNVQTAVDMFRAKQDSLTIQPVYTVTGSDVSAKIKSGELEAHTKSVDVVDFSKLYPQFLRELPKNVLEVQKTGVMGTIAFTDDDRTAGKVLYVIPSVYIDTDVTGPNLNTYQVGEEVYASGVMAVQVDPATPANLATGFTKVVVAN